MTKQNGTTPRALALPEGYEARVIAKVDGADGFLRELVRLSDGKVVTRSAFNQRLVAKAQQDARDPMPHGKGN